MFELYLSDGSAYVAEAGYPGGYNDPDVLAIVDAASVIASMWAEDFGRQPEDPVEAWDVLCEIWGASDAVSLAWQHAAVLGLVDGAEYFAH
jgi:hypothetical protein